MRIKTPILLSIIVALAAASSNTRATELDLWFTPMASQGPMKEPLIKWLKEHLPTKLPGVTVNDNFGPPVYQDGQQKFVVQGRKGKPDVIEAVLEGMIAYQRAGLLAPIDDLFDKWADKDQFIPSTIKALTLNGKLYGVPYNTNVRVLLYRKDLFQKYGLSVPKTWDEMLQEAATISSKESGVAGLGLTTKNGSVRTFQEFISFFFEVNNGENPFKYDESAKKWEMNTTPEKLATVLKLYSDFFLRRTRPPQTRIPVATITRQPTLTMCRAKVLWYQWGPGSIRIDRPGKSPKKSWKKRQELLRFLFRPMAFRRLILK